MSQTEQTPLRARTDRARLLNSRTTKLLLDHGNLLLRLIDQINGLRPDSDGPDLFLRFIDAPLGVYAGASASVGAVAGARSVAAAQERPEPTPESVLRLLEHNRAFARAHLHAALVTALSPPCSPSLSDLGKLEELADKIAKKAYMRAAVGVELEAVEQERVGADWEGVDWEEDAKTFGGW
jgi:hypothetical protein